MLPFIWPIRAPLRSRFFRASVAMPAGTICAANSRKLASTPVRCNGTQHVLRAWSTFARAPAVRSMT